jgi:hypothetical protein
MISGIFRSGFNLKFERYMSNAPAVVGLLTFYKFTGTHKLLPPCVSARDG